MFEGLIERGSLFAIQDGVVGEVVGGFGLVGGDDLDEGVLGHGLERVVDAALLADGGDGFFADGFAAERAGAVGGIDEAGVGKRKKFVVERFVEHAAQLRGGPAERGAEVGAADVADEERVAGEDCVGLGGADGEIVDEDRDGFGGVAGSLEGAEADLAEVDSLSIF